jgi:phenylalanyl-tRNA synthetase alpha chain
MLDKIIQIEEAAIEAINSAADIQSLEAARVKYLGKKSEFMQLLKSLGTLPPEERPKVGAQINQVKVKLQKVLNDKRMLLLQTEQGKYHPISLVMEECKDIFLRLGYEIAEGPDIELDYYNFDGLNIPPHHPSRDMWSTLFITDKVLLRTHTSPVQIRVMEKRKPPLAIIAPGRVYRRDSDATHSPVFHQLEGFLVDETVTFGDLKGTLTEFLRQMFGRKRNVRFRPSFFPFTEPSAEVDVECVMCNGKGCKLCKGTGWLEILGSGMIDPNVLKGVGYNPEKVSGFAFGMGIERIAMLKYGIDNIRLFFENDMRFLEQF